MGGTPQRSQTAQEMQCLEHVEQKNKPHLLKPKQLFEYNDLKPELTGQPNPNQS